MIIEACRPLVAEIEQHILLSSTVRAAFLAVDRGLFVQSYYEHQGTRWILRQDAHAVVYTDDALITKIDETGMPCSSSSMPSVMAMMLEALDVQPDQRVLEIGAGTGYNAALLRHLVGNGGQVVSVDIDEELVQQACVHMQAAGWDDVHFATANGLAGYAPLAPYERLIVTSGFRYLSSAWQEQLSSSGILVGNLLGPLASILLCLKKQKDGTLRGDLLPHGGFFMELRKSVAVTRRVTINWSDYDALPAKPYEGSVDITSILHNASFLFYLQGKRPAWRFELRHYGERFDNVYKWLLDTDQKGSLAFPFDPSGQRTVCEMRGNVCAEVLAIYGEWQQLGSPSLTAYQIATTSQGDVYAKVLGEHWQVNSTNENSSDANQGK